MCKGSVKKETGKEQREESRKYTYLSSKTYFVSLLTLLLNPSQIRLFG